VIVDIERFLDAEERYWRELGGMLEELESDLERTLSLAEAKRFYYLYQRASSGLARLAGFPHEMQIRVRLESLVARAYAEIHETRKRSYKLLPFKWFFGTFPRTFRRHGRLFWLAVLITLLGAAFGGYALHSDPGAKRIILPFSHLRVDPSERVDFEESRSEDPIKRHRGSFSAYLMTHNTKVSIFAMGLGVTFGIGTIILLFYNGVILGAVVFDYVAAGQAGFVAGWLLPHGAVEIPAILIAGQAGLLLGRVLIGWDTSDSIKSRLRAVSGDLVTLIFGVAVLLIWAGVVEAFLSQYHEPVIPYWSKIAFGLLELAALALFFTRFGRAGETGGRSAAVGGRT
jgi:uncharacterized membrane protein SpoIIM required for sporulation